MQTLIKWPGGKTSEYEIIKRFIPEYSRYIEPFFGGGAVFFNMSPQHAIINDISKNLMQFYTYIKTQNEKFKKYLYCIDNEWTLLKCLAHQEIEKLYQLFKTFRQGDHHKADFVKQIEESCISVTESLASSSLIILDKFLLHNELSRMVKDKFFRTRQNEIKSNKDLSDEDLCRNILTGFTSGYYMYIRNVLNRIECNKDDIEKEYKIAVFYFVREFCYGSMFRYNKTGEFNIPYGGIAYNNKDFRKKIDFLFTEETKSYLKNTDIYCCDFEEILSRTKEGDFIFLDPPYDTSFSDYENRRFGEKEQRRLAECLHDTKAKFLLIIKNTPLISELYTNSGYNFYAFDNQYAYCIKGRNDRNAVHLIITNYNSNKSF